MDFIVQYWYVLALVVLVVAYYGVNRYLKGRVKSVALTYLFAAEKMITTSTEAKLSVVSAVGYKALPPIVRTMVSPMAFELTVISAYNEVKDLIDKLHADPSVPMQNAVARNSITSVNPVNSVIVETTPSFK